MGDWNFMGDWNCIKCGQPMLPEGETKRPNEYDHAYGCPFETARLDADRAAQPKTQIREVFPDDGRVRTLYHGAGERYELVDIPTRVGSAWLQDSTGEIVGILIPEDVSTKPPFTTSPTREEALAWARQGEPAPSVLAGDLPAPEPDEIEREIRAIYDGWGESDDSVDDLVKRLAYLVRGAETRGRAKMREEAAMECKATGFVWSGTTVAEILYRRILALP